MSKALEFITIASGAVLAVAEVPEAMRDRIDAQAGGDGRTGGDPLAQPARMALALRMALVGRAPAAGDQMSHFARTNHPTLGPVIPEGALADLTTEDAAKVLAVAAPWILN